jgi:hypothetical protein
VFFGVTGSPGCAGEVMTWDMFAQADGVVISSRLEALRVAGVKAVASREVGDSREDEVITCFCS